MSLLDTFDSPEYLCSLCGEVLSAVFTDDLNFCSPGQKLIQVGEVHDVKLTLQVG